MLSPRDQAIVAERAAGTTVTALGRRHGISHQRVSAIIAEAREMLDMTQRELAAAATRGNEVAYAIPFGPDYQPEMAFIDWLTAQLRHRGVRLEVATRHAHNGVVLFLRDVTPHEGEAS
ncbi:MAG: hypothetical protein QOF68_554 [Gaiellales bacterium]|jgi:DNA-binding CsgD family transcriptional regulator|nr:hypothetical protein [Gaiellales bacterium]